jgi:flagellar hook protein FlgE
MPSDSMNIGVSGMNAYQAQIDVLSNDIANVGTTAFKGQNLSFQDLLYQTQQPGSGPTPTNAGVNYQQIGIGVKIGQTDTDPSQGGVQTTGVTSNMMINGDGYFILRNADGTGTPNYTRDGDFSLSSTGLLFDPSSGLAVMGYSADSAGNIVSGTPGPIQIPIGLKEIATATGTGVKTGPAGDKVFSMSWGGNLDSAQYAAAVSAGGVTPGSLTTAGTTIYDSLGGAHLVQITFQPQISSGGFGVPVQVTNPAGVAMTAATEWAYTLNSTDGTLFNDSTTVNGVVTNLPPSSVSPVQYAFFDAGGQFINTSGVSIPAAGQYHLTNALPSEVTGDQITVTQWGIPVNAINATSTPGATIPPSGPIGIDFSDLTANASASQVVANYQDGFAPGTLDNMEIGEDGTITGSYTNGQSVALAKIALATFQNEAGLVREGSNEYLQSVDSGEAQVGSAAVGRFGTITGNALELSNVSIGDEFTKLIVAQNAFTANSKSITTANEDDQTVVQLIH